MKNSRAFGFLATLTGMVLTVTSSMTNACTLPMYVTLDGDSTEWSHTDCSYPIDAQVHNGIADSWCYSWYRPSDYTYYFILSCYCWPSCHVGGYVCGMPATSTVFPSVGKYYLDAWAQQELPSQQYASDEHTIYVVEGSISATTTSLAVGGPRTALTFAMDTPTDSASRASCQVWLVVGGQYGGVELWDSPTGGQRLSPSYGYFTWPAGSNSNFEETVYVQGTSAGDDCWIAVLYCDANGRVHPYGCTAPHVDFGVYFADLEKTGAGNSPDLDPGLICINAQSQYNRAKYRALVSPAGTTASVSIAPGSSVTDIIFEGIDEANINALEYGDEFWVIGDEEVGDYDIKLTHNACSDASVTEGDQVFRFKFESEKYNQDSDVGGRATVNETAGSVVATHSTRDSSGVHNVGSVRWHYNLEVVAEPAGAYSGNVSARACIDFRCNTQMGITRSGQDGPGPAIGVGVNFGILSFFAGSGSPPSYGNCLADADTSIEIAGGAPAEYGDVHHERAEATKPFILDPPVETTWNQQLHQVKNDQSRTYMVGVPVDFKVRLSAGANGANGEGGTRYNWVSTNHASIASVEVTEYDGFAIVP